MPLVSDRGLGTTRQGSWLLYAVLAAAVLCSAFWAGLLVWLLVAL